MSTRKLNVPSLGFEVVVVGASDGTNELIAQMLEKKIVEEVTEDEEPQGCPVCTNVDRTCTCKGGA